MSDFDNFFREKLEEEQSFPRRNRSWKSVSKRLDAFDAGGHIGHSVLRYWQVAAVAASLTVGVLVWKVVELGQDKKELQQELSEVRSRPSEVAENSPKSEVVSPKSGEERIDPIVSGRQPEVNKENQQVLSRKPEVDPAKPAVAVTKRETNRRESKADTTKSDMAAQAPDTVHPAIQPEQANSGISAAPENKQKPPLAPLPDAPNPSENTSANGTLKNDTVAVITQMPVSDSARQTPVLTPEMKDMAVDAIHPPIPDSISVNKENPGKTENILEEQPEKPVVASKPEDQPRPVRTYDRVRAGAQIIGGFAIPGEKGVSMLQGQGITAAWRFWKDFSLTGSADWLRFDLKTSKFVPRFHPHHPHPYPGPHGPGGPGGPGPQEELVQVEGTQRQRQLSLGLRYAVPLRFWVRPTLQVAHTWVNIAPQLLRFKFEEQHQGGPVGPGGNHDPRYFVEKTGAQRLDRVWRLGVGLERETNRWAFSIGADYVKDFSASDAMFNSVLLKAGLQYKIL